MKTTCRLGFCLVSTIPHSTVKYLGKERAATVRNAGIEAGLLCADHPPREVSLAVEAARLAHACRAVHGPGEKK
jgi:hypothetical protein